jgi:hypothetical protein
MPTISSLAERLLASQLEFCCLELIDVSNIVLKTGFERGVNSFLEKNLPTSIYQNILGYLVVLLFSYLGCLVKSGLSYTHYFAKIGYVKSQN